MSQEIAERNSMQEVIDRLPDREQALLDMCRVMAKSTLVPKDLQHVPNMFVFAITAQDLGMSLAQALRTIYVVNGRPAMSSASMKALVLSSGKAEYFVVRDRTSAGVTVSTKRSGAPEEESVTFTPEDAKRAGLNSGTWKGYPVPMMEHRATAQLCRSVYPDVILGMYTEDELVTRVAQTPTIETATAESDDYLEEVDAILEEME